MVDVRSWVESHFHAVVLVACTPAADNICSSKNGLSIVDVLRPYSHIPQLNGARARAGGRARQRPLSLC